MFRLIANALRNGASIPPLPPPPAADEAAAEPSMSETSLYLGHYYDLATGHVGAPLPYAGERHALLFGPNGSGKGARILIPNLLNIRDRSVVVIDPKGELAAATADYRRTLGDVVILNPFNTLGLGTAGFNPLAALDPDSRTFFDDAARLGEALIKIEGNDPHWSQSARALFVALMMWEVMCAKTLNRAPLMENVRALLTEPDAFAPAKGKTRGKQVAGLSVTIQDICKYGTHAMRSLASRFISQRDEIAGVCSTADGQTWWMLSGPLSDNMARNDVDFSQLKKKPTTVYVVLPAEYLTSHAMWLRVVIVSAMRALYSTGGLRTLFILDEFAQLGHLTPVEDAFALVRGYGIQLWPVVQDVNQLKAIYKERWESLVSNAGIVQAFAPNDLTTANWMSKHTGDTTVVAQGFNKGGSQNNGGPSSSHGANFQQIKRPLLLPQELMAMRKGTGFIWTANGNGSIPFYAPFYEQVPHLKARAGHNPYRQS